MTIRDLVQFLLLNYDLDDLITYGFIQTTNENGGSVITIEDEELG